MEESCISPTAQRFADFIGGASYAVNGLFQAISGNIFLATPNGTYVSVVILEKNWRIILGGRGSLFKGNVLISSNKGIYGGIHMLTPVDLQQKKFAHGMGYAKKDVDAFFDKVVLSYTELYKSNDQVFRIG